jgi:hypothetical protein
VEASVAYPPAIGWANSWVDVINIGSPAVATGMSRTVSGEYVEQPIALLFTFTTDANVANRSVRVEYDDGNGTIFWSDGSGAVVQAGTTSRWRFSSERAAADWDQNNFVFAPLPNVPLFGGQKLQINLTSAQAGDQLSAIVLTVRRCLSNASAQEGAGAAT